METLYFASVAIYWLAIYYAGNQIKSEAMKIAKYYSVRWGINFDDIPVQKHRLTSNTLSAIIVSLIPGWNVLNAIFILIGAGPMKRVMWQHMHEVDRQHGNDLYY